MKWYSMGTPTTRKEIRNMRSNTDKGAQYRCSDCLDAKRCFDKSRCLFFSRTDEDINRADMVEAMMKRRTPMDGDRYELLDTGNFYEEEPVEVTMENTRRSYVNCSLDDLDAGRSICVGSKDMVQEIINLQPNIKVVERGGMYYITKMQKKRVSA